MEKIYLKIYCVVSIVSEYLFDSAVLSCETTRASRRGNPGFHLQDSEI